MKVHVLIAKITSGRLINNRLLMIKYRTFKPSSEQDHIFVEYIDHVAMNLRNLYLQTSEK